MSVSPRHPTLRSSVHGTRARGGPGVVAATVVALLAAVQVAPSPAAAEPGFGLVSSAGNPKVTSVASKKSAAVGVKFRPNVNGSVTAIRFYRGPKQKNKAFEASLWSTSGQRAAKVKFKKSSYVGWQTAKLKSPVSVKAGALYTASYLAKGGRYAVSLEGPNRGKGMTAVSLVGYVQKYTKTPTKPTKASPKGTSFLVDVVFAPTREASARRVASASGSRPANSTPKSTSTPKPTSTKPTTAAPKPTTAAPKPTASQPSTSPVGSDGIPRGFPNASTTGVRPGVTLRASGSLTVTRPGAVIEGLSVNGTITVRADNVVIRDTLIRGGGNGYPIRVMSGVRNTLIEYVEVDNLNSTGIGIFFNGGSGRVRYTDIHSAEDGIRIGADNVVVENSYIHDLHRVSGGHHDSIQIRSGNNVTIRGNTLLPYVSRTRDPMNAAIQVGSLTGSALRNFTVVDNYMNGGNYTINGGRSSYIASGTFTGNVFGTNYRYGVQTALGGVAWLRNTLVSGVSVR